MAKTTPPIRVAFVDYDDKGITFTEPSLTHQSFLEECDFNNVLQKWQKSGLITHINPNTPIYADVSQFGDYQSSLELIRSAQAQFDALPSSVRDRFDNDPSKLIAFLNDPDNRAEAEKLGLLNTPVVDTSAATTAKAEVSTTTSEASVA